jgi:UDP-N-acetyl-D-mannosaminuronate dehydrogenase
MVAVLTAAPTPLSTTKPPDLSYLVGTVEVIRLQLRQEQLIILRRHRLSGDD